MQSAGRLLPALTFRRPASDHCAGPYRRGRLGAAQRNCFMRATSFALLALAGLAAGCSERDRLTSGTWVCQPNPETRMSMRFVKEDKLEAKMELQNPPPDDVSLKMTLGGQW